jgi:hypothetical protein
MSLEEFPGGYLKGNGQESALRRFSAHKINSLQAEE